jgi:hypothetical protein
LEAFFAREDVINCRFGTVAATAWNASQKVTKKKDWLTWKDFFAPMSKQQVKKPGLTLEEKRAQVEAMRSEFYGWKYKN